MFCPVSQSCLDCGIPVRPLIGTGWENLHCGGLRLAHQFMRNSVPSTVCHDSMHVGLEPEKNEHILQVKWVARNEPLSTRTTTRRTTSTRTRAPSDAFIAMVITVLITIISISVSTIFFLHILTDYLPSPVCQQLQAGNHSLFPPPNHDSHESLLPFHALNL